MYLEKKYEIFLNRTKCLDIKFLFKESMKKHTTFKIGGPADIFITINTLDGLIDLLKIIKELKIPYHILGNGSNILVSDDGIRGIVIKLGSEFENIEILNNLSSSGVLVRCGSAVLNSKLCVFARNNGLSGLEFLYGIPGTVGGAVYMNAGAYSKEVKDIILCSDCINEDNKVLKLRKDEMLFSYRKSIYQKSKNIIVSATFKLKKLDQKVIECNMKNYFLKRKSSQPLNFPNAGSIFKRPKNTSYSAGKLIDESNLKGLFAGDAVVSPKHAGFIINKGNAKCTDVLKLIKIVKETVKNKSGFDLETEIEVWK